MASSNQGVYSERVFAATDTERRREIASEGSKGYRQSSNAREFGSEEAHGARREGGHSTVGNKAWNQEASR